MSERQPGGQEIPALLLSRKKICQQRWSYKCCNENVLHFTPSSREEIAATRWSITEWRAALRLLSNDCTLCEIF